VMMLQDVIRRKIPPEPWSEGDNIPWNDPGFSRRMLKEHLSQDHDLASRRFEIIDKHVEWIHHSLLNGIPTKILDLVCGPGLYTSRLVKLGHECVGIDYSPASIEFAKNQAISENLSCSYILEDIRTANYGEGYGLVMMIYGELNVFRPQHARNILQKVFDALIDNGLLIVEAQAFSTIRCEGEEKNTWYSSDGGLFSDQPHIVLKDNIWDAVKQVSTVRYFVIDSATGNVVKYAKSTQAYSKEEYHDLLTECGFQDVMFYPSLGGIDDKEDGLMVVVGRK
jgi:SAM-dependent methyltransferase